jgi:hypothetical protein
MILPGPAKFMKGQSILPIENPDEPNGFAY